MSSITKITTITREKFQKKLYSNYEKDKEIVDLRDTEGSLKAIVTKRGWF